MKQQKNKMPIDKNIKNNSTYLTTRLDIGVKNFDVGVRYLTVLDREIQLYYSNSLCDSSFIIMLMRELMRLVHLHENNSDVQGVIKNHLIHEQVKEIKTLDELVDNMLSGLIIILIDGEDTGLVIDVRKYPGREPKEPDVEKVIRGSKDGFTENIIENAGLIRRRIRDEKYRDELVRVGERSKTDVCLCYIKDIANPELIKTLKEELKLIEVDGIPMADATVEEFIVKQGWNPYPLVRYTGRPDVAAAHILEGHVLMITDTSPSVMIFPTTLFHHLQHAEEYRQTPAAGAFLRWVRFLAVIASVFLVPLWLLLVTGPHHLLPAALDFIGPNKHNYHIPLVLQVLIAEIGVETLRMAAIHTPTSLSTALGLIAAVLIGQIAVQVGVFVAEVILYTSVAAIGAFATPSYELGLANKMTRIVLIIAVGLFHIPGLMIASTLLIIRLATIKNLNSPYLWPFIPFDPMAMLNILVRTSMPLSRYRPSIVKPMNKTKQPKKGNAGI